MKNFLAFFVLFFGFCGSLSALTSEERFAEVQKEYKNIEKFTPDSKGAFVYVESTALKDQNGDLETFFTENPAKTLMIDFARGDGFVNEVGTINLGKYYIPSSLKKLVISNAQGDITTIGNDFLLNCRSLEVIDFSPLSKVRCIGHNFLFGCGVLRGIDLSPFAHVTRIGDWFLFGCRGLGAIDLSPLSAVTSIGNSFLSSCSGLKAIDLSPLSKVTSIGELFLFRCSGLGAIDLLPFSNVTSIGNSFLFGCRGLVAIDLSPLSKVTSIGHSFFYECSSLTEIHGLDHVSEQIQKAVIHMLRESDNEVQQKLGDGLFACYCTVSLLERRTRLT